MGEISSEFPTVFAVVCARVHACIRIRRNLIKLSLSASLPISFFLSLAQPTLRNTTHVQIK